MYAPIKHDNRRLDLSVGLVLSMAVGAASTPAQASPLGLIADDLSGQSRQPVRATPMPGEGYDPRYVDIAWRADLSGNGVVDFADIQLFMEAWNHSTSGADPGQADIDMDGRITFTDLNILLAVFGMAVSPPNTGAAPLQPGEGFSGPTPQPAAIGVPGSPGYDAKAIARWDVVPYQEISGEFEIGVVAFHRKGIDRVEFSLQGGPWLSVREMTENQRTGVWEYWTTINSNDLPDGPFEVRAVAYPNVGEPRVLEPLFLNANPRGTWGRGEVWVSSVNGDDSTGNGTESSPFRTIWRAMQSFGSGANVDGLTVNLKEGEYAFTGASSPRPATVDGWVTIAAAPGVDRDRVRLMGDPATQSNNRVRVERIHLRDLTIDQRNGWTISSFSTGAPALWLERITAMGPGPVTQSQLFRHQNWAGAYVIDSDISAYKNGCQGALLARGVRLTNLGSDAFGDSRLVINGSVHGISGNTNLGFHPDVYQFSGTTHRENTIIFGLQAYDVWAQGIFADDLPSISDAAFVNVMIQRNVSETVGAGDPMFSQWKVEPTNHLLLWHVTLVNQEMRLRCDGIRNLSVVGSVFQAVRGTDELQGQQDVVAAMGDWLSNHFVVASGFSVVTPGQSISTGDPVFSDPSGGDFRPAIDSPLRARLHLMCRPAADGVERHEVTSVGAFER